MRSLLSLKSLSVTMKIVAKISLKLLKRLQKFKLLMNLR